MVAGTHGIGGRDAESNFRLERTGFAGRSPGALGTSQTCPPMSPIPNFEKVEVAGQAKPWITMVHGMSQSRRVFSAQVGLFQKNYRLLLIDLPGHGKSSEMSGPYGPEEYAAATLAAMDAAGVEITHFW